MDNKELGAETCSKATPQAPAGLGPTGYDQGERMLHDYIIAVGKRIALAKERGQV